MLPNPFKFEKLKIIPYDTRDRATPGEPFTAMFNPESLSQDYELRYAGKKTIGGKKEAHFTVSNPSTMTLDLFLDGTGVDTMGVQTLFGETKSVKQRVDEFLAVAYDEESKTHEPRYLKVEWGDIKFPCRLRKATVAYTSFDPGGKPLRAKLTVNLVSDEEAQRVAKTLKKSSPDVSHTRVVVAGDTLPLLAKDVYGSVDHYLFVARANGLDDFRNLVPGQVLAFPPLETR